MNKLEFAKKLRDITDKHYNCAQSVLVPFAGEMGLGEEQAYKLGAHFGSGMRHGSACGALSGALMVLGAMGYGEQEAQAMLRSFREKNGCTDCAHLLANAKERGEEKKPHCDRLVCECVQGLMELSGK